MRRNGLFELFCFVATRNPRPLHTDGLLQFQSTTTRLDLVPISKFRNEITFLNEPDSVRCNVIDKDGCYKSDNGDVYQLGLAEEEDLPDLARFVIKVFGAEVIRVSQDFNEFERLLMRPAIDVVNGYSALVAFAEVLSGLRQRLDRRLKTGMSMDLSPPNLKGLDKAEKIRTSASTAVVLILGKKQPESEWHIDVIGSVELRLQLCDGKIPFTIPFLDTIERRLGSWFGFKKEAKTRNFQPYLSNLCVDETCRGQGVGRALVRCVENIVMTSWGYSKVYLHVDPDNEAALNLYKSEGYKDVGIRWNPFWAGKAADIGYYVKRLKRTS